MTGDRRARDVTLVLSVAAVVLWVGIVITVFQRQPVLGGDFMQFYVLGTLARAGDWAGQYDWSALHDLQASLVPGAASYFYAPAYPPLTSALYVPFASLPFPAAFVAWVAVSAAIYAWLMRLAALACTVVNRRHVVIGGLVFPPFVALIITGQSTLWPLIGFVGGWWALQRARPIVAGALFAAVAMKPHFGIALALVLLLTRSWRVVSGVVLGLTALGVLTFLVCGPDAMASYADRTLLALRDVGALEPIDTRHTHALRAALAAHAPPGVVLAGLILAGSAVTWITCRAWRSEQPWSIKVSALLIATLLISPHVLVYDGVLLAPATAWLADRAIRERQPSVLVGLSALAVLFVLPIARIVDVPLTLPLMGWLLWRCQATGVTQPEATGQALV